MLYYTSSDSAPVNSVDQRSHSSCPYFPASQSFYCNDGLPGLARAGPGEVILRPNSRGLFRSDVL